MFLASSSTPFLVPAGPAAFFSDFAALDFPAGGVALVLALPWIAGTAAGAALELTGCGALDSAADA
jgi:hypothetical protein